MGIVLAVKKKGRICIASDTMTISGGSRKQTAEHVANVAKIFACGSSYIGTADHPIWHLVLADYFQSAKHKPKFTAREDIFQEYLKIHVTLKEKYYLIPSGHDDDPFESSRFESLIVNPYGIFKTYELRSVQQFIHYAAIGTGAQYALGALHAVYNLLDSAEEIAEAAINATVAFEDSSGLPGIFHVVKSK